MYLRTLTPKLLQSLEAAALCASLCAWSGLTSGMPCTHEALCFSVGHGQKRRQSFFYLVELRKCSQMRKENVDKIKIAQRLQCTTGPTRMLDRSGSGTDCQAAAQSQYNHSVQCRGWTAINRCKIECNSSAAVCPTQVISQLPQDLHHCISLPLV